MPTSRARATLVAAVAVAPGCCPWCALQACTTTGGDPAGVSASAPTLSGELTRYRRDEALRRLQVKLGQAEGEPAAEVVSLRLSLPGYEDGPASELDSTSLPGSVVDLPVQLGDAVCPSAGEPTTEDAVPSGTAVAVATVRGRTARSRSRWRSPTPTASVRRPGHGSARRSRPWRPRRSSSARPGRVVAHRGR